jgi:ATP-dependent RNA helicase DDX56/DBP9
VLVPSRELVDQTAAVFTDLAYYCNDVIRVVGLGGGSHAEQAARLADGADVIVATPGRAVAHLTAGTLPPGALRHSCDTLVVDEADLVLSYGGGADTKALVAALPRVAQSLLVSATLSPALVELKRLVLHSPVVLKVEDEAAAGGASSSSGSGGGSLAQFYVRVGATDRYLLLFALIKLRLLATKVLVFVGDVDGAYKLRLFLERFGIAAGVLDATLPASARRHALEAFNRGNYDYLIATEEMLTDTRAAAGAVVDVSDSDEDEDEEDGEGSDSDDYDDEQEGDDDEAADDDEEAADDDEEEADDDASAARKAGGSRKRRRTTDAGAAASGKPASKRQAGGGGGAARDAEYGASRGLDFRGVATVVNFDFPASAESYTHRVGRTARGGASGVALSFLPPDGAVGPDALKAEAVLAKLTGGASSGTSTGSSSSSSSAAAAGGPVPLPFDTSEVEGFRYRVEDVLRGVTKAAVTEARRSELRRQMLASEALRAHFEDHPRDLAMLSHAAPVAPGAVKPHLRDVPAYLLPPALRAAVEAAGGGARGSGAAAGGKRKRGGAAGGGGGRGGKSASAPPPPEDLAAAAASGARLTGAQAIALASEDVYRARRNNGADPLRSLAAARAATSAVAAASSGRGRGGGGGGGRRGGGRR